MYIPRLSEGLFTRFSQQFRAVAINGIRQSGKSTLCRHIFSHKQYLSLENPDIKYYAEKDPRGFLAGLKDGAILDEAQRVPALFNYLQEILDVTKERGLFILTGSSSFLLNQAISQSLAGRMGYVDLLPLCKQEINFLNPEATIDELLFKGGMPEIWEKNINPILFFPGFILSFIEKDIRNLSNIADLFLFQQFIQLVAIRSSQEWNHSTAGNELGLDKKTIASWIGLLVAAGLVHNIQPYYRNFGKRVIQRPKIYLADTGLLCNFLQITNASMINLHPLKGAIFETWVILEILKLAAAEGPFTKIHYWRAISGIEIDCIIERNGKLIPIEIKSGLTMHDQWWKNLMKWGELVPEAAPGIIIFKGEESWNFSDGRRLLSYKDIPQIFADKILL